MIVLMMILPSSAQLQLSFSGAELALISTNSPPPTKKSSEASILHLKQSHKQLSDSNKIDLTCFTLLELLHMNYFTGI